MASTRIKKRARAIQGANPGMKYTEALRHAEADRFAWDPYADGLAAFESLPLTLGTDFEGRSLSLDLLTTQTRNLAICGPSSVGNTEVLRALAIGAQENGWRVSVVDPKHDEYRDIRAHSGDKDSLRDHHEGSLHGPLEQRAVRDFIQHGITPGTKGHPRLVVIDNGLYVAVDERGAPQDDGWVEALARLMDDPNTAVVFQVTRFNRKLTPAPILDRLKTRLLLGDHPQIGRMVALADVAPRKDIESFDFELPKPSQDWGVLWDGRHLRHVHVDHAPLG